MPRGYDLGAFPYPSRREMDGCLFLQAPKVGSVHVLSREKLSAPGVKLGIPGGAFHGDLEDGLTGFHRKC